MATELPGAETPRAQLEAWKTTTTTATATLAWATTLTRLHFFWAGWAEATPLDSDSRVWAGPMRWQLLGWAVFVRDPLV